MDRSMDGDRDWDKGQGEGQGDRERGRGTVIGKGTDGQSDQYRNRRTGKRIGGQQQRQLCVEWGSTTTGWHIYVRYVRVKLQHNGIRGWGIHGLNWGHLWLKWMGHLCPKMVGQLWQNESDRDRNRGTGIYGSTCTYYGCTYSTLLDCTMSLLDFSLFYLPINTLVAPDPGKPG